MLFHSFFLILSFIFSAVALSNRTIDDTTGDIVTGARPVYLPANTWAGPSCTGCAVKPDENQAFGGTWSAATYTPSLGSMSISFQFRGVAIYIYFILANNVAPGVATNTECNFMIDNQTVGSFKHDPTSSRDMQYNALVYSNETLSNDRHNFTIVTAGLDHNAFVNFDYAIYSFEGPGRNFTGSPFTRTLSVPAETLAPSEYHFGERQSHLPTGALIGIVVGGISTLILLFLLLWFFLRRRRDANLNTRATPYTPYTDPFYSNRRLMRAKSENSPMLTVTSMPYHQTTSEVGTTSFDASEVSYSQGIMGLPALLEQEQPPRRRPLPSVPVSPTVLSSLPTGEIVMSAAGPSTPTRRTALLSPTSSVTSRSSVGTPTQQRRRSMTKRELIAAQNAPPPPLPDSFASAEPEGRQSSVVAVAGDQGMSQEPRESDESMDMKEQIRIMRAQIKLLASTQTQRHSEEWVADGAPPEYEGSET